MSVNIELKDVELGNNESELMITIEAKLPLYLWSELNLGTTLYEEDIYKNLLKNKLYPHDFSSHSASLIHNQCNDTIKSLVKFYGSKRSIPQETLMSIIPTGYMQTRIIKYSLQQVYNIYIAAKKSIFTDAKDIVKFIENTGILNPIVKGPLCSTLQKLDISKT